MARGEVLSYTPLSYDRQCITGASQVRNATDSGIALPCIPLGSTLLNLLMSFGPYTRPRGVYQQAPGKRALVIGSAGISPKKSPSEAISTRRRMSSQCSIINRCNWVNGGGNLCTHIHRTQMLVSTSKWSRIHVTTIQLLAKLDGGCRKA